MNTEHRSPKATETREVHENQSHPSLKAVVHTLADWIAYLRSRSLTLLLFALIGLLIGGAWWALRPTKYTAATSFVLEASESGGGLGLGQMMGLASMVGLDIGGGEGGVFSGENIFELYKSRKLLSETLLSPLEAGDSSQLLIDRYIAHHGLQKKLMRQASKEGYALAPGFTVTKDGQAVAANAATRVTRLKDSILHQLVGRLNKKHLHIAKPDRKLDIIRVEVRDTDELFAKRFNEQLVQNVNDFYVQTKTKKSADNVALLQHKTDSVRNDMNLAISRAVTIADATPNINPTHQIRRNAPVQHAQFAAEANQAVLEELIKNLEIAKVNLQKDKPLIQVIDEPILPLKADNDRLFLLPIAGMILAFCLGAVYLLLRRIILHTLNS